MKHKCKECGMMVDDACSCNHNKENKPWPLIDHTPTVILYGVNLNPLPTPADPGGWVPLPITYPNVEKSVGMTYNNDIQNMIILAKEAAAHCRLTKSTTRVGCVIKSTKNLCYTGCNYDLEYQGPIHSEISAITNMVLHGEISEKISEILIYCERSQFSPCGACLTQINYFSENRDTMVHIYNGNKLFTYKISELLPILPKR